MGKTLTIDTILRCDVLVIGSGGAGLRAATAICEQIPAKKIIALTKVTSPQKSHKLQHREAWPRLIQKNP